MQVLYTQTHDELFSAVWAVPISFDESFKLFGTFHLNPRINVSINTLNTDPSG